MRSPTTDQLVLTQEEAEAELARRELVRRDARAKLLSFILATFPGFEVNWHHEYLCEVLELWVCRVIRKLVVVAPTRHSKTELVSRRTPAWIFGLDPDARVMGASHTASLANDVSSDIQRIMVGPQYRSIFPDTRLKEKGRTYVVGNEKRTANEFTILGRRGRYYCAGVEGSVAGRGYDYGIVDDPLKGWKDAHSPTKRDSVYHWLWHDFLTRQDSDEASSLVTTSRWSDQDPVGKLTDEIVKGLAEPWHVVHLEAKRTSKVFLPADPRQEGEYLWERKKGYVQQFEKHPALFAAVFQGQPSPGEGTTFKRTWFRRWEVQPPTEVWKRCCISLDCSFDNDKEDSSFVVMQSWAEVDHPAWGNELRYYLLDQRRAQLSFVETCAWLDAFIADWRGIEKRLVEKKANGAAVLSVFRKRFAMQAFEPGGYGSKVQRAVSVSPLFEAGQVWVPADSIIQHGRPCVEWVPNYIEELSSFPKSAFNDQVDGTSQALIEFTGGFDVLIGRADEADEEVERSRKLVVPMRPYLDAPLTAGNAARRTGSGTRALWNAR